MHCLLLTCPINFGILLYFIRLFLSIKKYNLNMHWIKNLTVFLFLSVVKFLEEEDTTVLVVATIAWGLRKCSHVIILTLIFLIAIRPGLFHAVYSKFNVQIPFMFFINLFIDILLMRNCSYLWKHERRIHSLPHQFCRL